VNTFHYYMYPLPRVPCRAVCPFSVWYLNFSICHVQRWFIVTFMYLIFFRTNQDGWWCTKMPVSTENIGFCSKFNPRYAFLILQIEI
jgi:hypothetical protein